MMHAQLPTVAVGFLRAHCSKKRRAVIRSFHRWMERWKIGFKDLRRAHIDSFIRCPNRKEISPAGSNHYRKYLLRYLVFLHQKRLLCFDPRCFDKRTVTALPQTALSHIRSLEPTLKNNTLNGHRVSLRNFHRWMERNGVSLDALRRSDTSAWLQTLSQSGYRTVTIKHHIIYVRIYLRWLHEQGVISSDPEELIRSSDMVKIPKYLPRPLSLAADKELQHRLAGSSDIYQQGLLLMRKTGLRIGELMSLEKNCVHTDHAGNRFLKVPLGKLNTERLVPLDDSTVQIIDRLRGTDEKAKTKTYLIETAAGKKTHYVNYTKALNRCCQSLDTGAKMVSHRLRHTYATELLGAGMSLVSLMKLLGHNDVQMTLRYAAITQETVGKEYFEALSQLERRYADILDTDVIVSQENNPAKTLADAIRLIQKLCAEQGSSKTLARSIIKRIQRIQTDLRSLFPFLS